MRLVVAGVGTLLIAWGLVEVMFVPAIRSAGGWRGPALCRSDIAEAIDGEGSGFDLCYLATQRNLVEHGLIVSGITAGTSLALLLLRNPRPDRPTPVPTAPTDIDEDALDGLWGRLAVDE